MRKENENFNYFENFSSSLILEDELKNDEIVFQIQKNDFTRSDSFIRMLEIYELIASGKLNDAKISLYHLHDSEPYSLSIYIAFAYLNLKIGNYENAIIWAECAQFMEFKSVETLLILALSLSKKGDHAHAKECLVRACKVAPAIDRPKQMLAALQCKQGDFRDAIKLYEELIEEYGQKVPYFEGLKICYAAMQDHVNLEKVNQILKLGL